VRGAGVRGRRASSWSDGMPSRGRRIRRDVEPFARILDRNCHRRPRHARAAPTDDGTAQANAQSLVASVFHSRPNPAKIHRQPPHPPVTTSIRRRYRHPPTQQTGRGQADENVPFDNIGLDELANRARLASPAHDRCCPPHRHPDVYLDVRLSLSRGKNNNFWYESSSRGQLFERSHRCDDIVTKGHHHYLFRSLFHRNSFRAAPWPLTFTFRPPDMAFFCISK